VPRLHHHQQQLELQPPNPLESPWLGGVYAANRGKKGRHWDGDMERIKLGMTGSE
jgi:hypothetical protein